MDSCLKYYEGCVPGCVAGCVCSCRGCVPGCVPRCCLPPCCTGATGPGGALGAPSVLFQAELIASSPFYQKSKILAPLPFAPVSFGSENYDAATGLFTTPLAGRYVFQFQVIGAGVLAGNTQVTVFLQVDGVPLRSYSKAGYFGLGTVIGSAMLELQQDQTVAVAVAAMDVNSLTAVVVTVLAGSSFSCYSLF